ncbi:hypothetical protein DFJ58DRAFT_746284 [Suillus subalutaceus]|uniref:uncharacterized protein n=1 Tax=Suillus subalutaceus TaxID=48586 RepID=UPI001B878796|nr:uncharacterized protein DFJ58DRAFT_746284 [Suillus subalutaceus]KAG1851451.1 hypothetical protein DFJ58DRAFT_746284 [Suillus subalutaceus]
MHARWKPATYMREPSQYSTLTSSLLAGSTAAFSRVKSIGVVACNLRILDSIVIGSNPSTRDSPWTTFKALPFTQL